MIDRIITSIPGLANADIHLREVIKGATVTFTLRVAGAGLMFLFNLILARKFDPAGSGLFYLSLTVATIGQVVACFGLGATLVRFIAEYSAKGDWVKVAGVYWLGIKIALGAALTVTLIVLSASEWMALSLFDEPLLVTPLRIMALGILPLTMITLYSELLRGLKKIRDSVLIVSVAVPLMTLIFLVTLGESATITRAVAAYLLSTMMAMTFGVYLWRKATPQIREATGHFDGSQLISTCIPLFWVSVVGIITASTGTIMLGYYSSSDDVGIYNIAMRTASLTSFILVAVNSIAAPKFSQLYSQNDHDALNKLARSSAKMMTILALPVQVTLVLGASLILSMFGPAFTQGATALVILSLAQFVNVATGSVGYLLIMSGHEKIVRNIAAIFAAVNLGLSVVLIPAYGVNGAAVSYAVTVAGANLASVLYVYFKLSIVTLPIPDRFLGK